MTQQATLRRFKQTLSMAALPLALLAPALTPLAFGADPIPITGDPAPGLETFDDAMTALMEKYGIPGATLAVVREEPGECEWSWNTVTVTGTVIAN